jgi:hypothetical protein
MSVGIKCVTIMNYIYRLCSNDDVVIEFTKDELEYSEFCKNILTDLSGNWIQPNETIDALLIDGKGIQQIKEFIQLRIRLGKAPKIRERPMEILDAEIVDNHKQPIGYNLVRIPPLVDAEAIAEWNSKETGFEEEYITYSLQFTTGEELFNAIVNADYFGCMDMVYLLQAKCAFHIVHYIKHYETKYKPDGSKAEIMEKFANWVREETDDNKVEFEFIKKFNEWKQRYEIIARRLIYTFIRHRSIDLPRETWTDEDWDEFKRELPIFYSKLNLTERQKQLILRIP